MKPEKITIKEPCFADWNKMQADNKGKFCGVCQTTVVDFTKMPLEDITRLLQDRNKEKICGRYHNRHVMAHSNIKWYQFLNSIEFRFSGTVYKRLAMGLISFCLIITSCRSRRTTGALFATSKDNKKKETINSLKNSNSTSSGS